MLLMLVAFTVQIRLLNPQYITVVIYLYPWVTNQKILR